MRKKSAKKQGAKKKRSVQKHPPIYYRLHALLHTVRAIERYEDQLCTLMTEVETLGMVSPAVHGELLALLDEIPASEYEADLKAVRNELGSMPDAT